MTKDYKTYNQQLTILRKRGMIVPTNGKPKRFLEQENYYNVINGYKDLFLSKNADGVVIIPEKFILGTHFDELKSLFLFDRELRFLFLKYLLIFENSFKTVLSHEFSKKHRGVNSYLDIANYRSDNPKDVLEQISMLTKTISNYVKQSGAVKHYIEEHGFVPLWVLTNYLTLGNLSHLYSILNDSDKNAIAKYYSDKYNKQYNSTKNMKVDTFEMESALKIFNLVRNQCAHDERLYNSDYKNTHVSKIVNYYGISNFSNSRIFVAILYFKILLNKNYYLNFHSELIEIFTNYKDHFHTVKFDDILYTMGINSAELDKLR